MIIAIALANPVGANAQKYDVLETVGADRCKLAGCEGPYRFEKNVQTPAPCGYRPVYISHYGRHGSRYAWNSQTYTLIHDVLDGAAQMGALTERGAKLRDDFNINTGFHSVDMTVMETKRLFRIWCKTCLIHSNTSY